MIFEVEIKLLSPLSLSSGGADTSLDVEIVHDKYGQPYFPAKRLKGLLYESAKEVAEMSEYAGKPLFSLEELDNLFQHNIETERQLIVHNLYLGDHEKVSKALAYLEQKYSDVITPDDVLGAYTSIRYQTAIDADTGLALDSSLRNLRVMDAGHTFKGSMEIVAGSENDALILALACRNLHFAGAKRNRGFGAIECSFTGMDKIIADGLK